MLFARMLAGAHQSAGTTGGRHDDNSILMAGVTTIGALVTKKQIDSVRNLILSGARPDDGGTYNRPLSGGGAGGIQSMGANQTALAASSSIGELASIDQLATGNQSILHDQTGVSSLSASFLSSTSTSTLANFSGWDLLLISVLISIILISIIGNCLVCMAIFTDRRLRKLGNAFIVSLAIADLFVSCLVMTFALCNDLMNHWMFGEWFCDIWISFDIMCCTASILNLCAISLDRFIHIKDCLLYNQLMTKRVAISAVIMIWIISALVSFVPINLGWHKPNHFKQRTITNSNNNNGSSSNNYNYNNDNNNNDINVASLSNPILTSAPTRDLDYHSEDQNFDGADGNNISKLVMPLASQGTKRKRARVRQEPVAAAEAAARLDSKTSFSSRRQKRQTSEHSIIETSQNIPCHQHQDELLDGATGMEPNDKISEIKFERASSARQLDAAETAQIANKLQRSDEDSLRPPTRPHHTDGPHRFGPESLSAPSRPKRDTRVAVPKDECKQEGPDSAAIATQARAPPETLVQESGHGDGENGATRRHSSPLVIPPGSGSPLERANLAGQVPSVPVGGGSISGGGDGDGNNLSRGAPGESNDDESKQRRRRAAVVSLSLHKNELFNQVALPEYNPATRQNSHEEHVGSILEQIKHLPPLEQMFDRGHQSGKGESAGAAASAGVPQAVAALYANTGRRRPTHDRPGLTTASSRAIRSPQEHSAEGHLSHGVQTDDSPEAALRIGDVHRDKVQLSRRRAALATQQRSRSEDKEHEDDEDDQRTETESHRTTLSDSPLLAAPTAASSAAAAEQQHYGTTFKRANLGEQPPNEMPQCMLTLTPTYAVISSTISFYIPCIIMLGLYSKLFACARRHVRNIKAISKAPQPIGFGSPVVSPMGLAAGQGMTTASYAISNDCGRLAEQSSGCLVGGGGSGEIINGRRPNATNASSSSLSFGLTSQTNNGPSSIGLQYRTKLARLVERPELNLADKSRTWIKFGRKSMATKSNATLKPIKATETPQALEPALSTNSELRMEAATAVVGVVSEKTAQSSFSPALMKLNSNFNKQNAQSPRTTTSSDSTPDYNDGGGNDEEHSKTIAHGNETEPFLNGHNDQEHARTRANKLPVQPGDDTYRTNEPTAEATAAEDLALAAEDLSADKRARQKAVAASATPEETAELSPSRTDASVAFSDANQRAQIITTTYTTTAGVVPFKPGEANNNHHRNHFRNQRQRQHQQQQLPLPPSPLPVQPSKQQTSQLATHKAAITLGIIMGTFLFCWVPFFCLNIIKAFHGDSIPNSLFRAFTWLGYANSALNPIIYGIHNSEFRNAFNRIFFKHLTLKNGRQYLNRRFSYDLRPHQPSQNQHQTHIQRLLHHRQHPQQQ